MHRTETVDYAVILSDEITMIFDDTDVHLKTGDTVVLCDTGRTWSNRSGDICEGCCHVN